MVAPGVQSHVGASPGTARDAMTGYLIRTVRLVPRASARTAALVAMPVSVVVMGHRDARHDVVTIGSRAGLAGLVTVAPDVPRGQ